MKSSYERMQELARVKYRIDTKEIEINFSGSSTCLCIRDVADNWDSIMRRHLNSVIDWMKRSGSSVILNWGEDTGTWEVAWITGGNRHTGVDSELSIALVKAIKSACSN